MTPSDYNLPLDGKAKGYLSFYAGQDARGELIVSIPIANRDFIFWPGHAFSHTAYRVDYTSVPLTEHIQGNLIALQDVGALAELLKALDGYYLPS